MKRLRKTGRTTGFQAKEVQQPKKSHPEIGRACVVSYSSRHAGKDVSECLQLYKT